MCLNISFTFFVLSGAQQHLCICGYRRDNKKLKGIICTNDFHVVYHDLKTLRSMNSTNVS